METLIIESYDHVIDIKGHQRKKEAKMLPARELAYLSNLLEMVEMLDAYDNTTVCRCIHLVLSQIWDILGCHLHVGISLFRYSLVGKT